MTTLIFGAQGYLGTQFVRDFPGAVGSAADVADRAAVSKALDQHRPGVVVNCAGKTGRPNVDWCEFHKDETFRSNVIGPTILLDECKRRNIRLVHLSTGCLYSGDNRGFGFAEDDESNFQESYYVRTKTLAERALLNSSALIIRPRMVFDGSLSERNLIVRLTKYQRVVDVANSLTYLPDLSHALQRLILQGSTGVFHVVNTGVTSPFRVMQRYRLVVDTAHSFDAITGSDLECITIAKRSNCRLSTDKLCAQGIATRPVDEAIEEALGSMCSTKQSDLIRQADDPAHRLHQWKAAQT